MNGITADPSLDAVERLLAENDLPVSDIRNNPDIVFVGINQNEETVGVAGLERYGSDALLRSLAVDRRFRGRGFGSLLVAHLEREAERTGVAAIYLLTTTAEAFFAGRGYENVSRSQAPDAIRKTSEFSSICPDSAAFMVKRAV